MGDTLLKKQKENKMNSNMTQFLALEKKFNEYIEKFKWWNGTEFGTIVGMFAALVEKSEIAWVICFVVFIFESVMAFIYMKKTDKILEEMRKL